MSASGGPGGVGGPGRGAPVRPGARGGEIAPEGQGKSLPGEGPSEFEALLEEAAGGTSGKSGAPAGASSLPGSTVRTAGGATVRSGATATAPGSSDGAGGATTGGDAGPLGPQPAPRAPRFGGVLTGGASLAGRAVGGSVGSGALATGTDPSSSPGGPGDTLPPPAAGAGAPTLRAGGGGSSLPSGLPTLAKGATGGEAALATRSLPAVAGPGGSDSTAAAPAGPAARRRPGQDQPAAGFEALGAEAGPLAPRLGGPAETVAQVARPDLPVQQLVDRLVEAASVRTVGERTEVDLQLDLGPLGSAEIQLARGEDGSLELRFVAADPATAAQLGKQASALAERLGERGLAVAQIEVASRDGSFQTQLEPSAKSDAGAGSEQGTRDGSRGRDQGGRDERSRGHHLTEAAAGTDDER